MTAGQNPSVDRGETVIRQQVIKARIPEQPVGLAVELRAEEKITRLREFDSLSQGHPKPVVVVPEPGLDLGIDSITGARHVHKRHVVESGQVFDKGSHAHGRPGDLEVRVADGQIKQFLFRLGRVRLRKRTVRFLLQAHNGSRVRSQVG